MVGYFSGIGSILIQFLFGIALFVVVLRLLLPMVGARFRNPICQIVYRVTNPVITPISRVIPNWRNVSIAALLLALLVAIVESAVLFALAGVMPGVLTVILVGVGLLLHYILGFYLIVIIIFSLMSFLSVDYGNPAVELLTALTTPVLRPFRRWPPRLEGIDLSPMWACLVIILLQYTLSYVGI